ncbi:hypothetical protein CC80DRAFT_81553 [Byssothecium circinans]|uniref:Mid2 domain-containing protein n=1 Tax=Byssothecium circinans TaxID=147558 RepID=A0A6A5TUA2_9PLEO|nr:hypothetical protein CC80DRAFT_81553 [Byssothecium circinans]
MRSFTTLPVSLLFYVLAQGAEQKCYGLLGNELDSTYAPCKSSTKHSGCCAIRRPVGSVDICLDNGLCMATNDEYMGSIWQKGCTDPTGKDPGCPKLCPDVTDDFAGGKKAHAWNIQMCDFGSYCCRGVDDRSNCCNNATAPKIKTTFLGAFQFETSTAGVSSTLTPTTATATPAIPTTTPAINAPQVAGTAVSTGAPFAITPTDLPSLCAAEKRKIASTVGGAVGGIMGAAIIGLLAVMFWMHKKEKRQRRLKEHYEAQSYTHRPGPVTVVYEKESEEVGNEVDDLM